MPGGAPPPGSTNISVRCRRIVGQIDASSEKIVKRGERINTMEFAQSEPAPKIEALPHLRLAKGGGE